MRGPGYRVDRQGSYENAFCEYGLCGIFVDKSGNRFMTNVEFTRSILRLGGSAYSFHMIKDGTADLQLDAIVLRYLFTAGSKEYVTISRETESGLKCTYKGGAPNI